MQLKKDLVSLKKHFLFFVLGFTGGWALIFLLIILLGNSLTYYFEDLLKIPFNIHHDLLGFLGLTGLWVFKNKFNEKNLWALTGFFLGILTQGIYFAGPQFITFF